MSKFKSRLSRYGIADCDQVAPADIIYSCKDATSLLQYISNLTIPDPRIKAILNKIPKFCGTPVQTGTVLLYTGLIPPDGYLLCNGQPISRTTYATLFSVIGTTYGTGDNINTFNLPDLIGKTGICTPLYIIKT